MNVLGIEVSLILIILKTVHIWFLCFFTKKASAETWHRMVWSSCQDLSCESDSGPKTKTRFHIPLTKKTYCFEGLVCLYEFSRKIGRAYSTKSGSSGRPECLTASAGLVVPVWVRLKNLAFWSSEAQRIGARSLSAGPLKGTHQTF